MIVQSGMSSTHLMIEIQNYWSFGFLFPPQSFVSHKFVCVPQMYVWVTYKVKNTSLVRPIRSSSLILISICFWLWVLIPLHVEQDNKISNLNVKLLNNRISECVIKLTLLYEKKLSYMSRKGQTGLYACFIIIIYVKKILKSIDERASKHVK